MKSTKTMPRMCTLKECVSETGLNYEFLRKLCLQKKIVFIKSGKKYLINLDRLIDFLNGEEIEAE